MPILKVFGIITNLLELDLGVLYQSCEDVAELFRLDKLALVCMFPIGSFYRLLRRLGFSVDPPSLLGPA